MACTWHEKHIRIPNRNIYPVRKTRLYFDGWRVPGTENISVSL